MHGAKSKHYNAQQILQKLPLCEAAPERELAQESKALLQQRSRMRREAVRSEVDIFHSKDCKSYLSAESDMTLYAANNASISGMEPDFDFMVWAIAHQPWEADKNRADSYGNSRDSHFLSCRKG